MTHIQDGKISRNKNFFLLEKISEYKRFRRAKLFLSLLDDLHITAVTKGNAIEIIEKRGQAQIHLFNPILRYRRKIKVSSAELNLLKTKTDFEFVTDNGSNSPV